MAPVAILRKLLLLVVVTALVSGLELAEPKGHSGAAGQLGSLLRLMEGQASVSLPSMITEAPQGEVSFWAPGPLWRNTSKERKGGREEKQVETL